MISEYSDRRKMLLVRSLDIFSDSRVQKYECWFEKNDIPYKIIGWDRLGKNLKRKNTDYCTINAGYNLGTGGIKYRIRWNIYLFKYLLKNRKNYDIIHACDFDTIIPALIMKLFGKKVIFDIFDWFSDEVRTGKVFIDFIINALEKLATKLADLTILCEEERLAQIQTIPKIYMVIPNIPTIDRANNEATFGTDISKKSIDIAYVGGFYPDRGLMELLDVVAHIPNITLKVAGFGNKEIEDKAKDYANLYPNITYYGKVEYDKAIQIMQSSDLLYAMYYKVNRNNIYAAPNKFYEAIFLNKPIITTRGTLVGEKVQKHDSGYIIEEGIESLKTLLNNLSLEDILKKGDSLKGYSDIYQNKLKECMDQYISFVQNTNENQGV